MRRNVGIENFLLRLYQNNYTPDATSVLADFLEANFTNYSEKTLSRSNFSAAATDVSGDAFTEYNSDQVWTCGATGNTIYGYYMVGATSGELYWAEEFATSRSLVNGDTLTIEKPSLTYRSQA
jgi:hypothetical protein